ncbi:uracil-5-carboxylate decarboxylase [Diplocarpon rosae]|nr:uracil-5-carboxylate decarboxylase [Diplocarpon rosae]
MDHREQMSTTRSPIVDIHTHVYPPSYVELLKSRSTIPYIRSSPPPSESLRLVILPAEETESTSRGRPVGAEYYDIHEKIKFMDTHSIDISVISLANPWLDWVPKDEAARAAQEINDEVNGECGRFPGRLFAFGTLPLSGGPEVMAREIARLKGLAYMRGVILGTTGLGKGLDDPELLPIFQCLQDAKLPVFLHPHYGLPGSVWGERAGDYGHVLPLALGFPLETTIAVTRMILSGASGEERVMFGTDHPFFPPLDQEGGKWASVETNFVAIKGALGSSEQARGALGGNAIRVLNLA